MNQARIDRVVEQMHADRLARILVTSPPSIAYLTGEWVQPGERLLALMIDEDGGATLFANRLFALGGKGLPLVEHDDTDDCIGRLACHLPAGRLGIDKTWPSGFAIRLMEARPDVQLALGSAPVDRARMIKDGDELARMRESSRLNDRAIGQAIDALELGKTEREIGWIYCEAAKALGAQNDGFALVCFGENGAEPHHASDDTRLRRGDMVILDVGAMLDNACSDMTRTVVMGAPTARQALVHDTVLRAMEAARAAVRPGVPLRAIDRAARQVIEQAGFGKFFIHRTGHGIGMEGHEPPDVSATSEVIAQPGMVFSIEPGIYLPGEFGVRIEDLVAVTEDGCETLNHFDRSLTTIE